MSAVNTAALVANLNAYCREHYEMIYRDVMLGLSNYFMKYNIQLWENVKNKMPIINGRIGHIVQPGNYNAWNPTVDAIIMDNRELTVGKAKVDLEFAAQQFENAWTQHLYKHSRVENNLEETPYHSFIVDSIIGAVARDIREGIWKGDTASATPHLAVVDGFIKTMRADAVAGNVPTVDITTFLSGGIFEENVFKALNYMKSAASDVHYDENLGMTMYVPRAVYSMVMDGSETAAGRSIPFDEVPGQIGMDKVFKFRGTNITMLPEYNLAYNAATGKAQIAMSTNDNLIVGTGDMNQANIIEFQILKRITCALMDFKYGANYANASAINRNVLVSDGFLTN